eukprot:TRINITY_DN3216_c0_g1_i2.p1 TRINITY_DN3216_c0_g1~~TRINITY_DN3216_c0_g1_i2.p1  ORF type:complete len:139 (+),score=31.02 TRINITY_DN3216_c0_g1_i2:238-654(+)
MSIVDTERGYLQELGTDIELLDDVKCYPYFRQTIMCQGPRAIFRGLYREGFIGDCRRLKHLWIACVKIRLSADMEDKMMYYEEGMERIRKDEEETKVKNTVFNFRGEGEMPTFFHDYQLMSYDQKLDLIKQMAEEEFD